MKKPSLEELAKALAAEEQKQTAKTLGRRKRNAEAPPARRSEDPGEKTAQEVPTNLRWQRPHIPFYENMGRLEFPDATEDVVTENETKPVVAPLTDEWAPGQPLLPPPPPSRPTSIALPTGDATDKLPQLPLLTTK